MNLTLKSGGSCLDFMASKTAWPCHYSMVTDNRHEGRSFTPEQLCPLTFLLFPKHVLYLRV